MPNIDEELVIAVRKRDLEKVKALLSAGANPNFQPGRIGLPHQYGYKLLHYASDGDIVKELLLNGAYVNSIDTNNGRTPLLAAIADGHTVKVIRELLKHGAAVNASDRRGNTPLNLAVKKSIKNLEVIRELLEYGADINIRNRERRAFENCNSPLDNAVRYTDRAELLIKITLINNFDKDYRKIINLDPYRGYSCYNTLSSYLGNCISEILKMKTDCISDNLSLYEFISKEANKDVLYVNDAGVNTITNRVLKVLADTRYPIYHDFILAKIGARLERGTLLSKLSELEVYTKSDMSNLSERVHEKTVVLDTYSKLEVAKYLSNTDLLQLITAFYIYRDEPPCLKRNSTDSNTRLNEASMSNYAKCPRLE